MVRAGAGLNRNHEGIDVNIDEKIDRSIAAKMRRDERNAEALERREAAAERQIGELCREGRPVYYVHPVGGQYREGTRVELVSYLLRNRCA